MTQEEFFAPIQDPYAKRLSESPIEDLIDDYNPGKRFSTCEFLKIYVISLRLSGATKEDGSINFECHCMSHMVASPCGHEFRQAMTCQRNAGEEAEQGMCAEEFIAFMDCVVQTKCFKSEFLVFGFNI